MSKYNNSTQNKNMTIGQMMESGNSNFNVEPSMAKQTKDEFNKDAYKYAIAQIESSGGKNLWNNTSSATGKYQFLYNLIKNDPSMKGVTRREFMNRPDLQEAIMDKALNGKLKGFTYGAGYAKKLKNEYNSDIGINQMTALVHFLGPGNARKFLSDPENFKVPGVNLSGQDYIDKFKKHYDTQIEHKEVSEYADQGINNTIQDEFIERMSKPQDNTHFSPRKEMIQPNIQRVENSPLQPKDPKEWSAMDVFDEINQLKYGGTVNTGGASDLVTIFEGGGTHAQNPLGGIPQGTGANGKPNLVEEGETKWNDYVFSNSISLDGEFSIGESNSNSYNLGGDLTELTEPTEPTDPKKKKESSNGQGVKVPAKRFGYGLLEEIIDNSSSNETSNYPMKFNKRISENIPGSDFTLENNRPNWTVGHFAGPLNQESINSPEYSKVDWGELGRQTGAKDFLDYYNNPKQREMMKEQMGINDEMYDNMIISGATAEMKDGDGWVHPESNAEYDHESHSIYTADKAKGDKSIERHERLHASGMDQAQGERLKKILGSAFDQGTGTSSFFKNNDPNRLRYYNKESEMYGNFAEFRTRLGWKPGQKITKKELEKLVKDKGLNTDEFYQIFDRDKLVKALNTVAYQDNNNIDNYRIS